MVAWPGSRVSVLNRRAGDQTGGSRNCILSQAIPSGFATGINVNGRERRRDGFVLHAYLPPSGRSLRTPLSGTATARPLTWGTWGHASGHL